MDGLKMTLKFEPEDFSAGLGDEHSARVAQKKFDEWLEKQELVFVQRDHTRSCWTADTQSSLADTHKARLVAIEEIGDE